MDLESLVNGAPSMAPAIKVGFSGAMGRGVFATADFMPGDLIETAPVIVIPAADWPMLEKTILFSYGYDFSSNGDEDMALALGLGSMYNHSYSPNAMYVKKITEREIGFFAISRIKKGEEITVNYNGRPESLDPLWFQVISGG